MKRSTRPHRATVLGVCAALPVSLALATTATADDAPGTVTIRVDATAAGRIVPDDSVGLSFEADQLHAQWTDPTGGTIAPLLRNLGTGNLRFSANQVDRSAWLPDPAAPAPAWAHGQVITPDDLTRVGDLAASTGWNIDLGVNLEHDDPAAAADEVATAQQRIGDALCSVQIGNEPNLFGVQNDPTTGLPRLYTPQTYVTDVQAYRDAIHTAAPAVPIEGPDIAGASIGNPVIDSVAENVTGPWTDAYLAAFGPESTFYNEHYYPLVNTDRSGIPSDVANLAGALPTVDRLLSADTAAREDDFLRRLDATAERAGLRARLSETNSVAHEGFPGVSNSFGGALWTVDYLLTAARAGISGVDLHNQIDDCTSYSLICFADPAAALGPNPNYYGLLLVSRMVGGAILPVTVQSGGANVSAFAVRMPDGTVKVAIDDKDRTFRGVVDVEIDGGSTRSASVERLTAASPDATTGTEFADAEVAADGSFTPLASEQATNANGHYTVSVDNPSAALLTTE